MGSGSYGQGKAVGIDLRRYPRDRERIMGLQNLNPKVFQMWDMQKDAGPAYFQPSTEEDIAEIERLVEARIPDDYREFLLEYSTVIGAYTIGAYFFPCRFRRKSVIVGSF